MSRVWRREAFIPWVIGITAFAMYCATLQSRLYGDGIHFLVHLEDVEGDLIYPHLLYLPLVKTLQVVVSWVVPIGPEFALKLTSALAGAVGSGLTYVIARECLASSMRGVASACLLVGMFGYWVHSTTTELHIVNAACSSLLLMILFRVLRDQSLDSWLECALLALSVALTPGSHLSGVCVGLPILYVWLHAGEARVRFALASGAGVAIFALTYFILHSHFSTYIDNFGTVHNVIWRNPDRVPSLLLNAAKEFSAYSIPAAPLIPVGFLCLRRSSPTVATLCVLWLLAWSLVAWPVLDRNATGSYYVPTYAIQSILAIAAWPVIAPTLVRAVVSLIVAFAPAAVSLACGETWALLSTLVSSILLIAIAWHNFDVPSKRRSSVYLLPTLTLVVTSLILVPRRHDDPRRDVIYRVAAIIQSASDREGGAEPIVMYMRTNLADHYFWLQFLPGAREDSNRVFSPIAGVRINVDLALETIDSYQAMLNRAAASGQAIWLYGSIAEVRLEGERGLPVIDGFLTYLTESFAFQSPSGAPENLFRLSAK